MRSQDEMTAFVKVVELASFTAAAEHLQVPKSTLSRWISRLEERLGAQLITRTTRSIYLTELGQAYYSRCRQIISSIEEAEESIREMNESPRGTLRITLPSSKQGSPFTQMLLQFLGAYPDVTLEILTTTRYVNMVEEGFDIAIRAGNLEDSSLVAKKVFDVQQHVVASPAYFEKHGTPASPDDLLHHKCLYHGVHSEQAQWITRQGRPIPIRPHFCSNDVELLHEAALQGYGLALLPGVLTADDLLQKRLLPALQDHITGQTGLFILYPPNRYLSQKVRVFVDFCTQHLRKHYQQLFEKT